jgi:hypothetical protein
MDEDGRKVDEEGDRDAGYVKKDRGKVRIKQMKTCQNKI